MQPSQHGFHWDPHQQRYTDRDGRPMESMVAPPAGYSINGSAGNKGIVPLVIGGILLMLCLIGWEFPFFNGHSMSQAHALCNSGLGVFAASIDSQIGTACNRVNGIYATVIVVGLIGVGLAAYGGYRVATRTGRQ